jgi:hypothetical protein
LWSEVIILMKKPQDTTIVSPWRINLANKTTRKCLLDELGDIMYCIGSSLVPALGTEANHAHANPDFELAELDLHVKKHKEQRDLFRMSIAELMSKSDFFSPITAMWSIYMYNQVMERCIYQFERYTNPIPPREEQVQIHSRRYYS